MKCILFRHCGILLKRRKSLHLFSSVSVPSDSNNARNYVKGDCFLSKFRKLPLLHFLAHKPVTLHFSYLVHTCVLNTSSVNLAPLKCLLQMSAHSIREFSRSKHPTPQHVISADIRPNTSHPHTRNLKKTDPVNRYGKCVVNKRLVCQRLEVFFCSYAQR